ncbi:MAG: signal peptidase I [Candidatus Magasanikbacteria bacterium]|nr:signal peptidase I [Candidatus Magasanikbacteria bacterium]
MLEKEPLDLDKKVVGERERSFLASAGLFFLELIKIVILAGVTIGLVRYFLFKPFYVRGQSMEPNFYEKDYLIIDELSYRLREPVRGEVIVFKAPNASKDYYLKRIVGLPGERVKVSDNKIIIYNNEYPQGMVLPEMYLDKTTVGEIDQTLGPNDYFVLGDNRGASYDSRRFGPIEKETIVGRAWLRGWPFTRAAAFSAPEYEL